MLTITRYPAPDQIHHTIRSAVLITSANTHELPTYSMQRNRTPVLCARVARSTLAVQSEYVIFVFHSKLPNGRRASIFLLSRHEPFSLPPLPPLHHSWKQAIATLITFCALSRQFPPRRRAEGEKRALTWFFFYRNKTRRQTEY